MPRPVLPDPVMPTITPWVHNDAGSRVTAEPFRVWSVPVCSPMRSLPETDPAGVGSDICRAWQKLSALP